MRKIEPINNNGSIQLKFSYAGKRYGFNPIPGGRYDNQRDINTARAIANQISNDILAKNFDVTLDKYRVVPKSSVAKAKEVLPEATKLLNLWDAWVDSLDLPNATKAHHYKAIRQQIIKSNPLTGDTSWFTKCDLSPATFNQRLGYLRACFKWSMVRGLTPNNPYDGIKSRKVTTKSVKPFTSEEIKRISEGFNDLYPHYLPFVKFLLSTGVRTSEAIGLRWGHVDFNRRIINIQESLSRDWAGNGYLRVRKETKTGNDRQLCMNESLLSLLNELKPAQTNKDSLVFTTINDKTIDDGNFRERYWVKVLAKMNVDYRNPYAMRHTTLSHAIDQGTPITGVAYIAGHKDTRMVMQTYGHMINRPELPEIL